MEKNLKHFQQEFNWSDELVNAVRERHLRLRILEAVKSGRLNQNPLHSPLKRKEVFVHAYEQKDGLVRAHTRGWPHRK